MTMLQMKPEITHPLPIALRLPLRPILLVEDSPDDANYVREILDEENSGGFTLTHVVRIQEALRQAATHRPWCVLLDLTLPDADGMEGLELFHSSFPDVPIVVFTNRNSKGVGIRAMQVGAQDYLMKDEVDSALLGRTLRYAAERKHAEVQFRSSGLHDPITGLPARALFLDRVVHALGLSWRKDCTPAVLFVDLEGLIDLDNPVEPKTSDEALVQFAARLVCSARPGDTVACFGGTEFGVLLENVNNDDGVFKIIERIRESFSVPVSIAGHDVSISVNIGAAIANGAEDVPDDLVDAAAAAMYRQRSNGTSEANEFQVSQFEHLLQMQNTLPEMRGIHNPDSELSMEPQIDLKDL